MTEIPVLALDGTLRAPESQMPVGFRNAGQIQVMIDGALTTAGSGSLHTTGDETKSSGVLTLNQAPVMPDAVVGGTSLLTRLAGKVATTLRGVANGYAGLNGAGNVIDANGVEVLPGGGGATLNATLISDWGLRVWKYIDYTTGAWPNRATSLPAGYGTNFVHWFCLGYTGTFTVPPTMVNGDIIWRPFP